MLANGSLLLQPVSKDHHGGWECLATNRVATVGAGTVVTVLGECCCQATVFPSSRHGANVACVVFRHQSSRRVIGLGHHGDESS